LFPGRKRITFRCEKCGDQIEFDLPPEKGKSLFPSPDQDKPLQPEKGVTPAPTAHDITEVQALKSKIRMTLMGFLPPMAQDNPQEKDYPEAGYGCQGCLDVSAEHLHVLNHT
jgi:hypothetical protein